MLGRNLNQFNDDVYYGQCSQCIKAIFYNFIADKRAKKVFTKKRGEENMSANPIREIYVTSKLN